MALTCAACSSCLSMIICGGFAPLAEAMRCSRCGTGCGRVTDGGGDAGRCWASPKAPPRALPAWTSPSRATAVPACSAALPPPSPCADAACCACTSLTAGCASLAAAWVPLKACACCGHGGRGGCACAFLAVGAPSVVPSCDAGALPLPSPVPAPAPACPPAPPCTQAAPRQPWAEPTCVEGALLCTSLISTGTLPKFSLWAGSSCVRSRA